MSVVPPMSALQPVRATQDAFRAAMRNLASGVSIVTAGSGEGRRGFTATSVSSLSLEPPTLIVCINHASSTLPVLLQHRFFGVNILAARDNAVAERFAGRGGVAGAERFAKGDWVTSATGVPLIVGALAGIDCSVEKIIPWHTHSIVIGAVLAVRLGSGERPLVYWRGGFEKPRRAKRRGPD